MRCTEQKLIINVDKEGCREKTWVQPIKLNNKIIKKNKNNGKQK